MVMSKARERADFNPEYYSGKNLLINGCFSVKQRSESVFANVSKYIVDRFRFLNSENSNVTVSTDFADDVKGKELTLSWQSTAATATKSMEQRVEDVRSVSGEMTFSLNLAHSLGETVTVYAEQHFGSNGDVPVILPEQVLTPNPVTGKYAVTLDVPSVNGKSIDDTDSSFRIGIKVSGNTEGQLKTSEWKLEVGDEATLFVADDETINLSKCQRYFWRESHVDGGEPIVWLGSNSGWSVYKQFAVTMRNTPAMELSSTLSRIATITGSIISNVVTTPMARSNQSWRYEFSGASTTTNAVSIFFGEIFYLEADAEL